jgi:cytochrome b6-f complex iron-sulfur subunit
MSQSRPEEEPEVGEQPRREFLSTVSSLAMAGGLVGGYGTFAYILGQFVYPAAQQNRGWLFVCTVDRLAPGESLDFTSPAGAKIVVARQGEGTAAEDFLALSSVCPHLGCRVHWEAQGERFFCPCHNGAFDRSGSPIAGPPKAANQSLVRFPLMVEGGLLYVEAPLTSVTEVAAATAPDPRDKGVA